MGRFTRISEDAFDALQTDAGVLLSNFNPASPYTTPASADIIATTTGGINPTCQPEYVDYGEDVDNVPNNMMEFKRCNGWNCAFGFTSIKFNAANTVWALGAATATTLSNGVKKIVPRKDVALTDFKDIWWVGDKANGGAYAIKLKNALSTGGLSIQSTKNGKGTSSMTITGHVSIQAQDEMPMEFYDIPPQGSDVDAMIELNHHVVTLAVDDTVSLVASTYPVSANATYSSGSDSVATVTSEGVVEAVAAGNTIITASMTVGGVTYEDTCTIIVPAST